MTEVMMNPVAAEGHHLSARCQAALWLYAAIKRLKHLARRHGVRLRQSSRGQGRRDTTMPNSSGGIAIVAYSAQPPGPDHPRHPRKIEGQPTLEGASAPRLVGPHRPLATAAPVRPSV